MLKLGGFSLGFFVLFLFLMCVGGGAKRDPVHLKNIIYMDSILLDYMKVY